MDSKDIDISFSNGVLPIRGEKKQEKEKKEENDHLIERSYGAFARSVQPVVLPRAEEAKSREIKIKVD